jgi:hypothetical protein
LLLTALAGPAVAAAPPPVVPSKADQARALMIGAVARFVEWPGAPGSQFTLCVADEHPQLAALHMFYDSATIGELPVQIRLFHKNETLAGCQAAFLLPGESADIAKLQSQAIAGHILLVGEGSGMAKQGVHIGFYPDMNHLKLEVNRKSLEASGLKASYRLLEKAKIVE